MTRINSHFLQYSSKPMAIIMRAIFRKGPGAVITSREIADELNIEGIGSKQVSAAIRHYNDYFIKKRKKKAYIEYVIVNTEDLGEVCEEAGHEGE